MDSESMLQNGSLNIIYCILLDTFKWFLINSEFCVTLVYVS